MVGEEETEVVRTEERAENREEDGWRRRQEEEDEMRSRWPELRLEDFGKRW